MIIEEVNTKEDLVVFVRELRIDAVDNIHSWENDTLERYFEAMAAWIADMDGLYKNNNIKMEDEPLWRGFARMLRASSMYE